MGEYADQALEYAARNTRDPRRHSGTSRNPKVTMCPVCKKGIRAIAGEVRESLSMHMKAKGCDVELKERDNG